ncbi:hypothetical protein C2W62_47350 [Candidatus Entotheonella serta]|nr:hypothetical protein C2W62_47350 [Candidatus Entotheonella serta]
MPEVSIEDSQLFLFDAEGRGICANEDNPALPITDPTRRLAALPLGACQIPAPGSYFLAISTSVRDPIDINGNDLFPDPVTDEERGMILQPIDPDAVINGWSGSGQIGNYAMLLTGVNYPSPECTLPQIVENAYGQRTVSLRVRDVVLGIASIEEVPNSRTANIAEVIIPVFPPGAVEVTVSAIDTNPFTADQVEIRVTNTVGGSITCTLNTPQAPQ